MIRLSQSAGALETCPSDLSAEVPAAAGTLVKEG